MSDTGRTFSTSSISRATSRTESSNFGPGTGASTQPNFINSMEWNSQTILFCINAWVLILAGCALLPLMPTRFLNKTYRLSLLGDLCLSLYSSYLLYGVPRTWNVPTLLSWFRVATSTWDFIHVLYCIILISSQIHIKFALIPVICRSLEHVSKFLRHTFSSTSPLYRRYLNQYCVWIDAHTRTLYFISSKAAIGVGFLLILSLVMRPRNTLAAFVYWQLLKVMYHAPGTAPYHQNIWARIGRAIEPLIVCYPFLRGPTMAARRWWFR